MFKILDIIDWWYKWVKYNACDVKPFTKNEKHLNEEL